MASLHRIQRLRARDYALATATVYSAYFLTRFIPELGVHAPFLLMIAAVVFTASAAGARAAFFAGLLATGSAAWILSRSDTFPDRADVTAIVLFAIVAIVLAWLVANRRQSLAALEASEQRYRTLVDMLPDAVFINRDARWVFANRAAVALLGAAAPADILGRSIFEFIPAEDRQAVSDRLRITRAGGQTPVRAGSMLRLDGTQVNVEVTATSLGDAGNGDIVVAMRDVTARMAAERGRTRSAAALKAVIDAAPIAVVTLESDAIVRTWNKAAETTFGWSAEDAIGRRYPIVGDSEEASFAASFSAAREAGDRARRLAIRWSGTARNCPGSTSKRPARPRWIRPP